MIHEHSALVCMLSNFYYQAYVYCSFFAIKILWDAIFPFPFRLL